MTKTAKQFKAPARNGDSGPPRASSPPLLGSPITYRVYGVGGASFDSIALKWLLQALDSGLAAASASEIPLSVAVALSFRADGVPDALILAAGARLLIVRLARRQGEPRRCAVGQFAAMQTLFGGKVTVEGSEVKVIAFRGAMVALRIHGATHLHCTLFDLSGLFNEPLSLTPLASAAKLLPAGLTAQIRDLKSKDFKLDRGRASASTVKNDAARTPIDDFLVTAQDALAAFHYAQHRTVAARLHAAQVDTCLLPQQDLAVGAAVMQSFHAMWALEPKTRNVSFASVEGGADSKSQGAKIECERFREQPRVSRNQTVVFTTSDGKMHHGRTEGTTGKTSHVRMFKGSEIPAGASAKRITAIEVIGRGDPSRATETSWAFWKKALQRQAKGDAERETAQQEAMRRLDGSGLFYPLFHGRAPCHPPAEWAEISRVWEHDAERYALIEGGRLDPSQTVAAKAIAAPLDATSRIILVQGPPGTGKTTVIGEFAKQWLAWSRAWQSMEDKTGALVSVWCVCQSNAATKNIASSLRRSEVPFALLVSNNFYKEWHEHMYGSVQDQLVLTSELKGRLAADRNFLRRIRVLLCTVDSLSSPMLIDAGVFRVRPVHCLLVDEASQLVLGSYPHLLQAHRATLGRIVFFGDDRQLAPFGADTLPADAIASVFELPHLRKTSYVLKRSYRLPRAMCAFVSHQVYDGILESGPGVRATPLEECVRFVDVASGREDRSGKSTSYRNAREAQLVTALVKGFAKGTKVDFRVLSTYTAQRDLIEASLRSAALPWEGRVFTADAFQGQEADIIILSLVRDGLHGKAGHGVGFIANQRRTNVMLTRAKVGMYVFSSKRFLVDGKAKAKDTLLGKLASRVGEAGWCSEVDVLNKRRALAHADGQ